jgi:integrase
MAISSRNGKRGTGTRHSKEDAVDGETFERLVATTYEMDDYYGLQARFVLFVCGRLGLRSGELAHMTEDWIDWRRSMISIPSHEPCTNGRGDSICGTCKQQADQKARVRRENGEDPDASGEDFYPLAWEPKTDAARREIAFDAVTRADIVIKRFFDRFDEWPHASQSVNRRVNKLARMTDGVDEADLYPHALRATAATFWAGNQIGPHALQSLMGWSQLSTSRKYISSSGDRTAAAMRDAML